MSTFSIITSFTTTLSPDTFEKEYLRYFPGHLCHAYRENGCGVFVSSCRTPVYSGACTVIYETAETGTKAELVLHGYGFPHCTAKRYAISELYRPELGMRERFLKLGSIAFVVRALYQFFDQIAYSIIELQ